MNNYTLPYVIFLVGSCTGIIFMGMLGILIWESFLATQKVPWFYMDNWMRVAIPELILMGLTLWTYELQEESE